MRGTARTAIAVMSCLMLAASVPNPVTQCHGTSVIEEAAECICDDPYVYDISGSGVGNPGCNGCQISWHWTVTNVANPNEPKVETEGFAFQSTRCNQSSSPITLLYPCTESDWVRFYMECSACQ